MISIIINILLTIFVIVSILLIFLTLMQRPKNEGLGAAFGGGMTDNLFGAETTNVLAKATRIMGASLLGLALLISFLYSHKATMPSSVKSQLPTKAVPAASPGLDEDAQAKQTLMDTIQKEVEKQKEKAKTEPATSATPEAAVSPAAAPAVSPAPSAAPSPAAAPAETK